MNRFGQIGAARSVHRHVAISSNLWQTSCIARGLFVPSCVEANRKLNGRKHTPQVLTTCGRKVMVRWLPLCLRVLMVAGLWLLFVPVCTSWL